MPFKKGSQGRPVGTKNKKTKQWQVLSDSITESHSENFNNYLNTLWEGSSEDKYKAANLYLQVLKYFKPKISNIQSTSNEPTIKEIIFVDAVKKNI